MPNIPVYQSQMRPRRPSGANAEAAARIGEIQQRTFSQLGQDVRDIGNMIDEQQGKQETSALTKDWALEEQSLTEDWNKTAAQADPNQIDRVADEWLEKTFQPRVDQFGKDVASTKGTQLRDRLRAGMQERFFRVVAGDKAALAGQAVQSNLEETGNALANAARLDPSAMNEYIAGVRLSIEEQITAHNLTADQAARVRGGVGDQIYKNIAMAAALGSAQRDPAQARKDLAAGKFSPYLTAEQQRQVINEIETQERAVKAEAERAKRDAEETRKANAEIAENEYTTQSILAPTKVDPRAIANDPRLNSDEKKAAIGFLETRLKPGSDAIVTNKQLYLELFNRIHAPDGFPGKITDETELNQYFSQLGPTALGQLRGEITGRRTQEGAVEADLKQAFVAQAKGRIGASDPLLRIPDPKGDENLYRFMQYFLPAYDKAVRQGGNPAELLAPGGAFDTAIKQYERPLAERLRDTMSSIGTGRGVIAPPTNAPAQQGGVIPRIKDNAEYMKLPSGAQFVDPEGKMRRKP